MPDFSPKPPLILVKTPSKRFCKECGASFMGTGNRKYCDAHLSNKTRGRSNAERQ